MDRIAVFGALQWECRTVLGHLRQVRRIRLGAFTCWQGRAGRGEVWVIRTGMGTARAAAAVDALGAAHGCRLFVSTGCAGGLDAALEPGDLVIADHILADGAEAPVPTSATARAEALAATAAAGLRVRGGLLLCCDAVLGTAAAKRAAAARGAVVVDMEGAPIATAAMAAGIPMLSVRAVLDGVEHELDLPGALVDPASGTLRPLTLARHLAAHPGALTDLLAMQRMQRAARESLERFFGRWLAG